MGTTRDYYADLELTADAEEQDVKKAYRKLALKYHPDRHPGREAEFNPKFLIIQEAHDVLVDSEQRARYDSSRRSNNRYSGGASGVRGNPWSNVGSQFPTPPRRNPNPGARGATSGADRWSGRFATGVPPTARQQTASDAQTKKNAAKAFESMRKEKSQAKAGQRPTAPPPPPRTEAAKNRAQAAFGAKKGGYHPHTSSAGDEPPVTNNNYAPRNYQRPPTEAPKVPSQTVPMTDPLSQFRDNSDPRQSTPYSKHGGEKTNPFEGLNFGRSKSTREPPSRDGTSSDEPSSRPRSHTQGTNTAAQSSGKHSSDSDDLNAARETPSKPTNTSGHRSSIFNLSDDDEPAQTNSAKNFARSSADNINTSFVNDDNDTWQFTAGGGIDQSAPAQARSRSAGTAGRRSPSKHSTMNRPEAYDAAASSANESSSAFNADGWSDKFKPQDFVPPPTASPSKATRRDSRKTKVPFVPPPPEKVIIIDSSDDEDRFKWPGRKGSGIATDSPQPMDIDPPQANMPAHEHNGVRNIPVEPSRAEWRSGDFDTTPNEKAPVHEADAKSAKTNTKGSEDSEEFQASFADLKNVAPFSNQGAGFKSMDDLRANLPFESKASGKISISPPVAEPQPLSFPSHPEAPRPPPTLAIQGMKPTVASWEKYVTEFEQYMQAWESFDSKVTDHFLARRSDNQAKRRQAGYSFLRARGPEGCLEYYRGVRQDNDVRNKWTQASEDHEQRLQEFLTFRERMTK